MPLTREKKEDIITEYATHEGDTGSPEVQVALLTERITGLTEHLRAFPRIITRAAACSSSLASVADSSRI